MHLMVLTANHLWSGSTAPNRRICWGWNTSLLAGNGDYEWVCQSGGGGNGLH